MPDNSPDQPQDSEPQIALIGIGGAGSNILDLIGGESIVADARHSVNLDLRLLNASSAPGKIHLGETLTHGLGSGGDPDVGARAARQGEEALAAILEGRDLVILLAGLGGGTGSGATPVIAQMARERKAFTVAVVTMPFTFEGARRNQQAVMAMEQLASSADLVLCFENDRMESLLEGEQRALEAFEASNRLLAQAAEAIPALAFKPGLLHVGLDDLKALIGPDTKGCRFGIGTAEGPDRASRAARKALQCPLFACNEDQQTPSHVLVHISGPSSLSVAEMEAIVDIMNTATGRQGHIHFGVSVLPEAGESVKVMVFAPNLETASQPAVPESPPAGVEPAHVAPSPVSALPVEPAAEEQDEQEEEEQIPLSEAQLESVIEYDETPSPAPAPELPEEEEPEEDPVDYPAGSPSRESQPDPDPEQSKAVPSAMGEFNFDLVEPPVKPPVAKHEPEPRESGYASYRENESSPSFKGLFSDDDPFIVDGEDLDLPPSMRKKK